MLFETMFDLGSGVDSHSQQCWLEVTLRRAIARDEEIAKTKTELTYASGLLVCG